jgi:hypothetical protein
VGWLASLERLALGRLPTAPVPEVPMARQEAGRPVPATSLRAVRRLALQAAMLTRRLVALPDVLAPPRAGRYGQRLRRARLPMPQ